MIFMSKSTTLPHSTQWKQNWGSNQSVEHRSHLILCFEEPEVFAWAMGVYILLENLSDEVGWKWSSATMAFSMKKFIRCHFIIFDNLCWKRNLLESLKWRSIQIMLSFKKVYLLWQVNLHTSIKQINWIIGTWATNICMGDFSWIFSVWTSPKCCWA